MTALLFDTTSPANPDEYRHKTDEVYHHSNFSDGLRKAGS